MTTTTAPGLSSRRGAEHAATRQAAAGGTPPAATPAPVAVVAADQATRLAAIQQDARKRAYVAYTMAKTLLPQSESAVVARMASALIETPTALLTAAFRQLATLTATCKLAEKFEDISKTKLNEFVEDPSLLSKLQGEVTSELKGDPKTAAAKPKTAAPGDEPKKEGEEGGEEPVPDALPGDAATEPPAEMPATEPPAAPPAEVGDLGAAGDGMPANDVVPESGADAGLMGQIENVEAEISQLEQQVGEVEDGALDLASIFDPEIQAGKANSLADEGTDMAEMGGDDFFGPSSKDEMEGGMDFGAPETGNPQDFFSGGHTTASLQVDAFLAGRNASSDVDVAMGDMEGHFETDLPSDTRNVDTDHSGDMLSEVLDSLDQEAMTQKRDTAPKFTEPESVTANQRTAAEARARVAAGPKAAPARPATPKKSSVNPGQPGLPKQASGALDVTPNEIDTLLFRDRY